MKKLSLIVVLSLFVSVLGFQSCTKEDEALKAPELPKTQMMLMDFNGFDKVDPDQRSFSNWFHAAVNVYFWTRTVYEVVHIPVTAFVVAINQQAVYQGNDTWMWTFSVNEGNAQYIVELYGTLDMLNEEVDWAMFVSSTGVFEEFPWVTGSTAFDESYSNFLLSTFADEEGGDYTAVEYLSIQYNKDLDTETEGIRYTIVVPGDPNNGSYIQYGNSVDEEYPVFYDINSVEANNTTEIRFNPESKYGKVKDPKRFHDEEWHCWDAMTNDIEC
jgi:hypothetical protein